MLRYANEVAHVKSVHQVLRNANTDKTEKNLVNWTLGGKACASQQPPNFKFYIIFIINVKVQK